MTENIPLKSRTDLSRLFASQVVSHCLKNWCRTGNNIVSCTDNNGVSTLNNFHKLPFCLRPVSNADGLESTILWNLAWFSQFKWLVWESEVAAVHPIKKGKAFIADFLDRKQCSTFHQIITSYPNWQFRAPLSAK
jgi:hypothetical protein